MEMFTVSDTGPIGCIMNVLATCAFCCTAAFVYKKFQTRSAVIGLALGTVCLTVVMLLWNYLITPIYMGMDREEIVVVAGVRCYPGAAAAPFEVPENLTWNAEAGCAVLGDLPYVYDPNSGWLLDPEAARSTMRTTGGSTTRPREI